MNSPPPPKATLIIPPNEISVFSENSRINVYDARPYNILREVSFAYTFINHIRIMCRNDLCDSKLPLLHPYAIIEGFAIETERMERVYNVIREIHKNRKRKRNLRNISSMHYTLMKKLFCIVRGENRLQVEEDQIKNIYEYYNVAYNEHYDSDDDDDGDFCTKKSSSQDTKIGWFMSMVSPFRRWRQRCHIEG